MRSPSSLGAQGNRAPKPRSARAPFGQSETNRERFERTQQEAYESSHASPHPSARPRPEYALPPKRDFAKKLPAIIAVAAILIACAGIFAWKSAPITLTVNGQQIELNCDATVQDAFEAAGSPALAGNLLDIDGEMLQESGGCAYAATLDGETLADVDAAATPLAGHKTLDFSNGADVQEPSTVAENQPIAHEVVDEGNGTFHIVKQVGHDGLGTVKTGDISGKQQVIEVTEEPVDTIYSRCYADVGDEKVIALTFDDGPWNGTGELLDVLAENDAKATFFVVGNRVENGGAETVQREAAEGHQVATHTYDHAAGSGQSVNLSYMTKEEQREEISKGFQAIEDATGQTPSFVMRAPGGNFPTEVWANVEDLIVADIRWDIDTHDWEKPGANAIEKQLLSATPGDVVLMHDGGGDRSQTIEALKNGLPKLKAAGWKFVTIDELLQYPTK